MTKKETTEVELKDYLSVDYLIEHECSSVSICPSLDVVIGGAKEGSITILSGPEGLGKTSYGLAIIRNAQKEGRVGVYTNAEHRLHAGLLRAIKDLDTSADKFKLITSQSGRMLVAEQFLALSEKALSDFPGCVLLFDSFSDLVSAEESQSEYGKGFTGTEARKLEAQFCRRIAPIININKNIVVAIAHINMGVGMYASYAEKVSKQTKYQADLVVRCSKNKDFEIKENDVVVGHRLDWTVMKNSFGPPGGKAVSHLRYGFGPDEFYDISMLGVQLNIIQKSGSWFTINEERFHGMPAVYNYLQNNPDSYREVYEKVREILK